MKLSIQQLQEMEKKYAKYWWKKDEEAEYRKISSDPFKLLIFTILSQNTSGINTRRAYAGLSKKFSIDASTLSNAREEEIALAIKPGGLYKIKARRIKQVSKYIMDKYKGNLKKLLSEDKEKIKEELMKLPGVGNKTADVIISSIYGQKNAFVIDTHMRRMAIRLGIANEKSSYKELQEALSNIFPWHDISNKEDKIAGLFWLLAKHTCRAINPKCEECILKNKCRFYATQK